MKIITKSLDKIERITLNHPELNVSFNNIKNIKINKKLLFKIFDELLEWCLIGGILIIVFCLFFAQFMNETAYYITVVIGLVMIIVPIDVCIEIISREDSKKHKKSKNISRK